jgi:drug/metabolite transporter (DMT)-like permease
VADPVASSVRQAALWALFFASSIYGHVALKVAVNRASSGTLGATLRAALGPWGLSAFASWTASGVLWMLVLARRPLMAANSISSLRYALVCASAWVFLGERVAPSQLAGVALIAAGILLAAR